MSVTTALSRSSIQHQPGRLARLFDYKPFLIVVCLTPAIGLLLVFLTYPLGLGVWLAFTDTTIGRRGVFVGLENFQYLLSDPLWWGAVFYSIFYTAVATFGKFALGFWLALLLNNHFPFKSILRAIVLLPWIVPTVLSALALLLSLGLSHQLALTFRWEETAAMAGAVALTALFVADGRSRRWEGSVLVASFLAVAVWFWLA